VTSADENVNSWPMAKWDPSSADVAAVFVILKDENALEK
jgi:hypothetical protein